MVKIKKNDNVAFFLVFKKQAAIGNLVI